MDNLRLIATTLQAPLIYFNSLCAQQSNPLFVFKVLSLNKLLDHLCIIHELQHFTDTLLLPEGLLHIAL
jgi:hypothetical protein